MESVGVGTEIITVSLQSDPLLGVQHSGPQSPQSLRIFQSDQLVRNCGLRALTVRLRLPGVERDGAADLPVVSEDKSGHYRREEISD